MDQGSGVRVFRQRVLLSMITLILEITRQFWRIQSNSTEHMCCYELVQLFSIRVFEIHVGGGDNYLVVFFYDKYGIELKLV